MEGLYKNKYKIKSSRLPSWDYSNDGYYFVTICTKNREFLFGKIINGKMVLNKFGKIAETEWKKTELIRKNVALDEYIIMPNHLHGILIIENKNDVVETQCLASKKTHYVETHCNVSKKETQCLASKKTHYVETQNIASLRKTHRNVSKNNMETHINASLRKTQSIVSLQQCDDEYKNKFGPQKNNLSSIIRGFKSSVTKQINEIRNTPNLPVWQPKFYDHIIRDEKSLNEIGKYIIDNPDKWERDKDNPANLYM